MATALMLARGEGRMPPQDLEAETSVLGAILLDQAAITRVLDFLAPEDFYRENNGQVYRAALNLFREGEPIDNVTLAAELEKLGVLERIGGRAQLALLQESVPTAANVEHYARIVKDRAYKRRLITAGGQVTALGYDDSLDAEEAVNQAQANVYAISDERVGSGLERLYDLLRPAMDRIDAQMATGGGVIGVPSGFHDLDRMTNGFKPSDLVIIAGRPAMGKCLRANTLVVDPDSGLRLTIEQAVDRKMTNVFGLDTSGRVRSTVVADWVDSGIQKCYRVTLRTGRIVEVTHHHPFMTVWGWEPLHDITVGEHIAIPRHVPCFGRDDSLGTDQVRLLGYLIAEGTINGAGGSPAFSNTDPAIINDFRAIIAHRYPELRLRFDGRCTYWVSREGRGGRDRPNPLVAFLREFGLWGKRADTKRFPAAAWTWDRSRLREFIRTVMSCDGTIYSMHGHARIEFAVASEGLAEDMQHALTRFGVVAKLWRKKDRCWRVEVTEPRSVSIYQEQIGWIGEKADRFPTPDDMPRFANAGHLPAAVWPLVRAVAKSNNCTLNDLAVAVGERHAGKRGYNPHVRRGLPVERMAAYADALDSPLLRRLGSPDLYWDEVVSIEPIGEHQVYDLTVPDGANFIAADVVVHNTSFVTNVALHAAVDHKKPVVIFSLEMSKEQLVERLLCEQARIDAQRMHRGTLSDAEYERLAGALGPLGDAPIFIDDSPTLDDLTMRLKSRQARSREGIEMVIVDYLQLMHGRTKSEDANRVQEVSNISRSLKAIARELRIPVIAISQLSRAPEARPDKRPILSDLRESGSIEQDADIVMFLYRDEYYNRDKSEKPGIAEIIVAKHRNGPTGMVELMFRRELTRFENLERRRPEGTLGVGPDS
jgi:replicative DNA helicase